MHGWMNDEGQPEEAQPTCPHFCSAHLSKRFFVLFFSFVHLALPSVCCVGANHFIVIPIKLTRGRLLDSRCQ